MKKQQQTRVRLKASVKEMLKQNPMRAINIKSISAASHISRTSFYANFESMDDLIYELHDDSTRRNWRRSIKKICVLPVILSLKVH